MEFRRLTQSLTFSGALPFYLLLIPGLPFFTEAGRLEAFLAYGATIAAFMAGTLWGLVQTGERGDIGVLLLSNVLALIIWGSLLLTDQRAALLLQLVIFIAALGVDRMIRKRLGEPDWYFTMRVRISGLVCLAYAVALFLF